MASTQPATTTDHKDQQDLHQHLQQSWKFWPSALTRAGHTTVCVTDPQEALFQYLQHHVQPSTHFQTQIRMGRCCAHVPCFLQPTSPHKNGTPRWWCPVHQGEYLGHGKNHTVRCSQAHDPVDFVCVADIPVFTLVDDRSASKPEDNKKKKDHEYRELGIWIGLPPAMEATFRTSPPPVWAPHVWLLHVAFFSCSLSYIVHAYLHIFWGLAILSPQLEHRLWMTACFWSGLALVEIAARFILKRLHGGGQWHKSKQRYYPGIHVHARRQLGGPKVVDTNFPAVTLRDKTGRFPYLAGPEGVTLTSPAALEFLYFMENHCPVNAELQVKAGAEFRRGPPRSPVRLTGNVACEHCGALQEDIGNVHGQVPRSERQCGQCGRTTVYRDAHGVPTAVIANPLQALQRDYQRQVVGQYSQKALAELHLTRSQYPRVMMWPSTPALFWSRPSPEVWGVHVHAFDKLGTHKRPIDDTFGHVWLDGVLLDRADLFRNMVAGTAWLQNPTARQAVELEDD